MKTSNAITLMILLAIQSPLVHAAPRTATLSVPGMTCPACPITVKTALSRVPGVSAVQVSYEQKQAVVTFDDSKATVSSLTEATAQAGYPSTPAQ